MALPSYITVIKAGIEEAFPFASVSVWSSDIFGSHTISMKFVGSFTRWNGFTTNTRLGLGINVTDFSMMRGPDASVVIEQFVRDFENHFKQLEESGKFEKKYYTKIEIPGYKTIYRYKPPHAYMKFHR